MKKIIHKYMSDHSLLSELLITVLLIFTISMVILASYSIEKIKKEKEDLYRSNLESISSLIEKTTSKQLAEMTANAYIFGIDNTLTAYQQTYKMDKTNPAAYVKLNSYVNEQLMQMEKILDDILYGTLYIHEDQIFYPYTHILKKDLDLSKLNEVLQEISFENFFHIFPITQNPFFVSNEQVIPVVYAIGPYKNDYLICLISISKLETLYKQHYLSFFDDIEIVNDQTIITSGIYPIEYDFSDGSVYTDVIDGTSFLLMKSHDSTYGWDIHLAKDNSDIINSINKIKISMTLILIIMLAIAYVAILNIYYRFRIPFDSLSSLMEKNSTSISYEHFNYSAGNEIGQLGKLYNEMIDEIENLVLQLQDKIEQLEEEKRMKEWEQDQKILAEIKALQAQINPHFLYNALNSIVWTAEDHEDNEIKEMTLRLANFYKIGLSRGNDMLKLKDEVEHARNYLWIQCQRYDQIKYVFNVDSSLYGITVPKLILQPLIENAIYHGIKPMNGKGRIEIRIEKINSAVSIIVENTGLMIDRALLSEINDNMANGVIDSKSGYGIYNVNNRIRLTYGKEWGLHLESLDNITRSIILLPADSEVTNENTNC